MTWCCNHVMCSLSLYDVVLLSFNVLLSNYSVFFSLSDVLYVLSLSDVLYVLSLCDVFSSLCGMFCHYDKYLCHCAMWFCRYVTYWDDFSNETTYHNQ